MDEEQPKVQKYLRVPVSDKNHNFLSVLNERARKVFDNRLRAYSILLVEKLKRGTKI